MEYKDGKPPLATSAVIVAALIGIIAFGAYKSGRLSEETLVSWLVLMPAVVLHEISHGFLANMFGDPTAKRAGRLSLNPVRHVDPIGTFILPGLLLLSTNGGTSFGWAKPVPVDVSHMSRNKSMLVGLVGPFTNVVLSLLTVVVLHIVFDPQKVVETRSAYYWTLYTLVAFGHVNVVLAVYNMLPIPPLDGSSVIERFIPQRYHYRYLQLRKYSIFLLLIVTLAYSKVLSIVFEPALHLWDNLVPWQ